MTRYDANYSQLATMLLPNCLRGDTMKAILKTVMTPLVYLSSLFRSFREDKDYRMSHNGQTCYLRGVLNDAFDGDERRITITDGDASDQTVFLHKRSVGTAVSIPKQHDGSTPIYRRNYGSVKGINFVVKVPLVLKFYIKENMLKALVDAYKLASVRYSINYE